MLVGCVSGEASAGLSSSFAGSHTPPGKGRGGKFFYFTISMRWCFILPPFFAGGMVS